MSRPPSTNFLKIWVYKFFLKILEFLYIKFTYKTYKEEIIYNIILKKLLVAAEETRDSGARSGPSGREASSAGAPVRKDVYVYTYTFYLYILRVRGESEKGGLGSRV